MFQGIDLVQQRILNCGFHVAAGLQLLLHVSKIAQTAISHGKLIVNA